MLVFMALAGNGFIFDSPKTACMSWHTTSEFANITGNTNRAFWIRKGRLHRGSVGISQ